MDDLISRDAAMNIFAVDLAEKDRRVSYQGFCIDAVMALMSLPSVEKTGYNLKADTPTLFECSVCGWSCWDTVPGDGEYKYCPNCGARMVKE